MSTTMGGSTQQQQSPKQILDQLKQTCEQTKQQLSQQLNQVPNQQARTAVQMAINAVDHCIAQAHTATGALS